MPSIAITAGNRCATASGVFKILRNDSQAMSAFAQSGHSFGA
jgi:hypothetical protein